MAQPSQQTLAAPVTLEGVGVHSGERAVLRFVPSDPDTGLRFVRVDLEGCPAIPADLDHVVGTDLGTSLGQDDARVLTVEHVLAALHSHGVDNAVLELSGPEPPIRDGSFEDYSRAIQGVGVVRQSEPARVLALDAVVTSEGTHGESYVATPAPALKVSAAIDFSHPAIGRQYGSFPVTPASFAAELAPARTFGFRAEAEALLARGLARGASLENTIVLDETGVMNDALRFPDEYVRHKIGDILGDLALLGCRLQAHVVAERPSHKGNVALARAIAERARRATAAPVVEAAQILNYLPHRYPMLLVDRIVEFESGKRIVGLKNVTINEPFFQGHYPGHPVMPGVLIIEAMAQVGGLLLMEAVPNPENKVVYFMSLDNVKWRRPVIPGDQIVFELEMVQFRRHVCRMRGIGSVDGNRVVEGELMAMIVDRDKGTSDAS
ncbi:MAG: UDP-3-O-[3-hydroxymyristoyl] N-acetylglucosamine deacetylase [Gemmatimonadetes bacterium]|nr:UDP-3-O-[3-hydroxymyristoyl] N-acetylglucosamine deacetylase [Gemmatimonadota bacterium]